MRRSLDLFRRGLPRSTTSTTAAFTLIELLVVIAILAILIALMFVLFHQRVCGPLANSLFHHRPDEILKPASKIEAAYHKADHAIQQVLDQLAA